MLEIMVWALFIYIYYLKFKYFHILVNILNNVALFLELFFFMLKLNSCLCFVTKMSRIIWLKFVLLRMVVDIWGIVEIMFECWKIYFMVALAWVQHCWIVMLYMQWLYDKFILIWHAILQSKLVQRAFLITAFVFKLTQCLHLTWR